MYMFMCVCVCVYRYMCAHMCEGQADTDSFLNHSMFYFFETNSLTEPGAHCFIQMGALLSPRNPRVSASPS